MSESRIRLEPAWKARVGDWLQREDMQALSAFRCNATLIAKGREVNAKSIMGVMLLAAGHGTQVVLRVEGEDEAAAADAVAALFERRFDEEG